MKINLFKNVIVAGALCTTLVIPSFGQIGDATNMKKSIVEGIPIRNELHHWAKSHIDQLVKEYSVESILKDKNLDDVINVEDFQRLVRLIVDEGYNGTPDTMTRETVVREIMAIWAEKTDQKLDDIPIIEMLIYSDTHEIDAKYNHSISVAYMKDIAKGVGLGIFNPKANITYGQLAALLNNTRTAIEKELTPDHQGIAKGRFETRGSYEIQEDKVVFDFELMSHHTVPKELQFGSGQQFEVTITDELGKEVYRYSDNKFFTLALVYKNIKPGESMKWQDEWDMTNKEGQRLTSGKYKVEISIVVNPTENQEKIDKSELTTVVDVDLLSRNEN